MKKHMLLTAVMGAVVAMTGCQKDEAAQEVFKPVAIHKHDRCVLCGMVVLNYEGPKAQLYIKDVNEPLTFCSGRDAFSFALQPENARRLKAFFIHDIAKTDFDEPKLEGFMSAKEAVYVYGSRREGVMGVEPIAFSDKKSAQAFIEQWGGRLLSYPDITLSVLEKDN